MAQTQGGTNFVKVENLPPGLIDCQELHAHFSVVGNIQDITAVSPTTVIISYERRSGAAQAAFALDGVTIGGVTTRVTHWDNMADLQFFSNPAYQSLGQYIGAASHSFHPANFQPWGTAPAHQLNTQNLHHQPLLAPQPPPFLQPAPGLFVPPYVPGLSAGQHNSQGFFGMLGNLLPPFPGPSNPPSSSSSGAPAPTSSAPATMLEQHTVLWRPEEQRGEARQCNICLCDMEKGSGCRSLAQCLHTFHTACLEAMVAASPSPFLQCPTCKKVHGVRTGTRPLTGQMSHRLKRDCLPGHEGSGTIEIHFNFQPGVQGPEHPQPGAAYTASNFPRVAYLPDNPQGERALHGVYLAWSQRLMFTVGRSITTQRDNCVTWNDIHMKTNICSSEHGYPDPQYLANLAQDLAGFGITEAQIVEHMASHPHLRDRGGL